MACAGSQVRLSNIYLDIDPEVYKPITAERRGSEHVIVDEERAFQDMGVFQSDTKVTLSGKLAFQSTVEAIAALYASPAGTTFEFADWMGNLYTVMWAPGASFDPEKIYGSAGGWQYSITLNVVSITTYFGGASPF